MLKIASIITGILVWLLLGCEHIPQVEPIESCFIEQDSSHLNLKHTRYQDLLHKYTSQGLPGLAVAVYSPETGLWLGSSGYANVENQQDLRSCHAFASASIGKLYCAVAMLRLQEEGFLDLDDEVRKYLPEDKIAAITNGAPITIRELLNHTSGMSNVDNNIKLTTQILRNPEEINAEFLLELIYDSAPEKNARGRFFYSSSGFELLSRIIDTVYEPGHVSYYQGIFDELGLRSTYYKDGNSFPDLPTSVEYYLDRFDNGKIENISQTNHILTNALTGSDGVIATPRDHIQFLRAIFEGNFLDTASFDQLIEQTNTSYSSKPAYGLGLWFKESEWGLAMGHDGGSIGAGADLWYFPEHDTYVFSATNIGIFFSDSRVANLYREDFITELFQLAME